MPVFEKEIEFETSSSVYISRIRQYWESKGFKLTFVNNNLITGERGSRLKNNFVMNMMKVHSFLTVEIREDSVHAKVEVDAFGQILTAAESEYWPLEMEAFKQFILYNKNMDEEFKLYYKGARKAVAKIFIMLIVGAVLLGLLAGFFILQ